MSAYNTRRNLPAEGYLAKCARQRKRTRRIKRIALTTVLAALFTYFLAPPLLEVAAKRLDYHLEHQANYYEGKNNE